MLQPKLTKVEPVKPLKLCLYYETGEVKLFDAAPYATGSWYGRLQDERYFATVHLLPGGIGIEWEEGHPDRLDAFCHRMLRKAEIIRIIKIRTCVDTTLYNQFLILWKRSSV